MGADYDPRAHGARCDACSMGGPGSRPTCVPPAGNPQARLALVGEAPGKNELQKLRPFVGASGIKLDEILWAAGVTRSEVWVSNAALCRVEVPDPEAKDRYSAEEYMKWIAAENKRRRQAAKKNKTQPDLLVDPFAACRPRLMRELKQLEDAARAGGAPSGVVVVPMGNFALNALRGVKGIMKYRGSIFPPRPDDFLEGGTT